MDFTHLHVHSEYSILDGINKLGKLSERIKELGMSACALTDHGNLRGAIEFYKEAKKVGIKPLIGIEAYITLDADGTEKKTRDNGHLILIAASDEGLRNLFWLTTNAALNNFYYNPRIYWRHLAEHSKGIIASTACLGGYLADGWRAEEQEGIRRLKYLQEVFGDRLYIEIQDHRFEDQAKYNAWLLHQSFSESIKPVITSDAHFLNNDDFAVHEMAMSQQLKQTMTEYRSGEQMNHYHECYIKTPEQMLASAKKYECEAAFHNTVELAQRCSLTIELGKYKMPEFDVQRANDYEAFLEYRRQQGT